MNPEIDGSGTKRWFNQYGQLHREDRPACEWSNGSKFWYLNGLLHRIDGPAIEWYTGGKSWYLNDICFQEKHWLNKVLFSEVKIELYES
jgi:hypothetical protein